MPWDNKALKRLREELARLYPNVSDARIIAVDAGLDYARIPLSDKAINYWFLILEHANSRPGKVEAIVELALKEFPDDEALQAAARGSPPPIPQEPDPAGLRGPGAAIQLEEIIDPQSTLISIAHLEVSLLRSRSVARIRLANGNIGTGFLTAHDILISAHHVLPDKASAHSASVQFNFQEAVSGEPAPIEQLTLSPDSLFVCSPEYDWTAVRIESGANERWGALDLSRRTPEVGDHINIVQHPDGGLKRISFSGNTVVSVENGRVQYLTYASPNSSGSPVFDHLWNVIGVHSAGGGLDAFGATKFYRNQATLIDRIIDGLAAANAL